MKYIAMVLTALTLTACGGTPVMPAKEDIKRMPVMTNKGPIKLRYVPDSGLVPYETDDTILERVTWFYGKGNAATRGFFGLSLYKKDETKEVKSVSVAEIAAADEVFTFKDSEFVTKASRITVETSEEDIRPSTFPWFYKEGDQMMVFEVVVEYTDGEKDKMYQGFYLSQDFKDTLKGRKK